MKMKGTDVLQQAQDEDRQHLQVLRDRELCARARARSGHARLVRLEDLDHLVEQGITSILKFVCDRPFNRFVGQQSGNGNLIRRSKDVRKIARSGQSSGDNTNTTLACVRSL